MWIEAPADRGTTRLSQRVTDGDGKVVDTHVAEFNHNRRAEVTKKAGAFFLRQIAVLKEVKDGGPKERKAAEAEPVEAVPTTEGQEEVATDA